jgi:hypothetical protein
MKFCGGRHSTSAVTLCWLPSGRRLPASSSLGVKLCTHHIHFDSTSSAEWQEPSVLMRCDIDLMPVDIDEGVDVDATQGDAG